MPGQSYNYLLKLGISEMEITLNVGRRWIIKIVTYCTRFDEDPLFCG